MAILKHVRAVCLNERAVIPKAAQDSKTATFYSDIPHTMRNAPGLTISVRSPVGARLSITPHEATAGSECGGEGVYSE